MVAVQALSTNFQRAQPDGGQIHVLIQKFMSYNINSSCLSPPRCKFLFDARYHKPQIWI